jgi:predicted metal-dependent TIM-barrel fold hydrolase
MLIDHVTPETYPAVRAEGYHTVGMTLQPGKTSVGDLAEFIREQPDRAESIVLGSDGAREISDWFFHFLDHRETLGEEERRRLLLENAREFWGIEG